MRNAFIRALEDYSQKNTMLIVGDLGYGVVDNFKNNFPKQFLNAGVAEQNMTGIAAGMAMAGKKVFTYSIANFNTIRALEQIRNDIAYHNLNVTVVSVGGGFAYGSLGISHHATEDLAIMRAIPNMTILAPGDTMEAYELTRKLITEDIGPAYLRLGQALSLHSKENIKNLEIGKGLPLIIQDDNRMAIISTGGMLESAKEVSQMLLEKGVKSSVFSFHTIKPIDVELIIKIFNTYENVFSFEEHSIIGGLSSSIAESLIGKKGMKLENYYPFALPSKFISVVGDQNYLKNYCGISSVKIFQRILHIIGQ